MFNIKAGGLGGNELRSSMLLVSMQNELLWPALQVVCWN